MAYRSRIEELVRMRARGQRPDLPVVVGASGESAAWAQRNGFFFVPASECGGDTGAFAGLFVLMRERSIYRLRDLAERLAMSAQMVILFSLDTRRAEYLKA
jgi:hypothetical protein